MPDGRQRLLTSLRATTAWTMLSRVLGLVRDMVVAALLGLASGGVADALVIAMSVPNLFRQLFGEGALTATFLPVLSRRLQTDRAAAWRLSSVVLAWLAIGLSGLVLIGELLLGGAWLIWRDERSVSLLLGLSAVTLPYMVLVCLAAQMTAILNTVGRFGVGAAMPALMNVVLIAGAVAAPWISHHPVVQAYIVAGSVLLGGIVQLGALWPALRAVGFRFDYQPAEHRAELRAIGAAMLPMVLGLAATQINVVLDRLIAFGFSGPMDDPHGIRWLGGVGFPMRPGATAAIYYGERLYQLPIGILGVAVATVIFPRLAQHAAQKSRDALRADLTLGLRLVTFYALPASLGLVLLAGPLATLLFQRGRFTPEDAARTARLIACYGLGVWSFCAVPTLVRGYYALQRHSAAVRISLAAMAVNLALDLSLIWPLAEAGLAVATVISATLQVIVLAMGLWWLEHSLVSRPLVATFARSGLATLVMGAACYGSLWGLATLGVSGPVPLVVLPVATAVAVYLGMAWLLRCDELRLLWGRKAP